MIEYKIAFALFIVLWALSAIRSEEGGHGLIRILFGFCDAILFLMAGAAMLAALAVGLKVFEVV